MDGRMKIVIAVLLVASVGLTEGRKRTKRNLIQLAEQLKSLTGRDPLDFNGYGCYCGWGGSGTPVDEADRCCKNHDDCYGNVSNDLHGCEPKWTEYKWNIDRNIDSNIDRKSILCLDQANAMIFKPTSSQNCQRRICECDKALSECLNKSPYNKDNYELDKKQRC